MKKINSKNLLIILAMLLMISMSSIAFAEVRNDYDNSWGKNEIEYLKDRNIIGGYNDGNFRPNSEITRAEFVKIINKVFGLYEKANINFEDVNKQDWYYEDVSIAVKSGYINGYNDNCMKPDAPITRQEAAKIISIIYELKNEKSQIDKYNDTKDISNWAVSPINKVITNGIMLGYEDNTFKPTSNITRCEVAKIICNASSKIYNSKGEYSAKTEGNVIINSSDVTLKNMVINNDLYLAEGIGDGNVYLDNVTVNGRLIIRGGGENSIYINNSNINELISNRKNFSARMILKGSTKVENFLIREMTIIELEDESSISQLSIYNKLKLLLNEKTSISAVIVNSENTEIQCKGKIDKITANEKLNVNGIEVEKNMEVSVKNNDITAIEEDVSDNSGKPNRPNKPEEPEEPNKPEGPDNYSFKANTDKLNYSIEEIITLNVEVLKNNIGMENSQITLKLMSNEELITVDQIKTDSNGKCTYKFKVPNTTFAGKCKLILYSNEPVNKTIELSFSIEGKIIVNKELLKNKFKEIEFLNLKEEKYTKESWLLLKNALNKAKNVFEDENATQIQVDMVLKTLTQALNGLEKTVINKSELLLQLTEAIKLKAEDYTEESWNKFEIELINAKETAKNEEATQDEVDKALKLLNESIQALEPANNTNVSIIFRTFTTKNGTSFDKIVIGDIITELTAEVKGYSSDILVTTDGLSDDEISSLIITSDDKSILSVTQRPIWSDGGFNYTNTRFYGKGISAGETKVIVTVTDKNGKTYKGELKVIVEKPVVKASLNTKIKEAEKIDLKQYTEETVSILKTALDKAKEVSKNTKATQADVDTAKESLIKAIEALVKKAPEEPDELPNKDIGLQYYVDLDKVLLSISSMDIDSANYFKVTIGNSKSTIGFYTWFGEVNMNMSLVDFLALINEPNTAITVEVFSDEQGINLVDKFNTTVNKMQ